MEFFPPWMFKNFANYELEFDFNNLCKPLDEEIRDMLALEDTFIDGKKKLVSIIMWWQKL
jgi:hypothetical protein